ncbi:S8 family serine peptidase [Dactylosporangium sp. NBC_01737]|uniref:S8 family serine peptidase n=1 Tax=Dactylosporangium sp. NBC_01737 TaxID=2975959 RepID=UPI002E0E99DD
MLSTLGSLPGVLSIAATARSDKLAGGSPGLSLDLVAPGDKLVVPTKLSLGDEYVETGGTDLAPAVVGGVAALVRARYPALPAQDVVRRLTAGSRTHSLDRGWGAADSVAVVLAARRR